MTSIIMFQLSAAGCFMAAITLVTSPPFNMTWGLFTVSAASLLVGAGLYNLYLVKAMWQEL